MRMRITLAVALITSLIGWAPSSAKNVQSPLSQKLTSHTFIQLGHSDNVVSVAFSPDGSYALTGSFDDTAKLWEVSSGREVRSFKGHSDNVMSVAFSPDGSYALTGSFDGTAKLWEVSSGREVRSFKGHSGLVMSVAFSPDGSYALTGSHDGTAKLWEVSSGREVRSFKGHSDNVTSVAFSPDGLYVLTGGFDGTAKLWEVSSGREVRTFKGHSSVVCIVAFSPDGRYALTGSVDDTAKLWEVSTGREIRTFKGHSSVVYTVAFSPDGRYALTGSYDGTAKLWEVSSGREIRTFNGGPDKGFFQSVAFSPDGRYALTGEGSARRYSGNVARLFEVSSGREIKTLGGHSMRIDSIAFSPDGRYALTGMGNIARLWEVLNGREVRTFGKLGWGRSVAFSPDGRYALTGEAWLWEVSSGREATNFWGAAPFAFSPDGRYVLAGEGSGKSNAAKLWEVSSGREVRSFKGHSKRLQSIAFSPDGRYALTGSFDDTAKLWEVSSGREVRSFKGHSDNVMSVAFSPDGFYVLTGSGGGDATLWEVSSGHEVRTFKGHTDMDYSVAFSPDGRYVLTGSTVNTAKLWEVSTGREIRTFSDSAGPVAFSPDGSYALTGSVDGSARLWEVSSGREICRFVSFKDGEWIVMTPEGFFNSSPNAAKHVNVRMSNDVYSIDQFYDSLYRPDLVEVKLRGDPNGIVAKAASKLNLGILLAQGAAPRVRFLSPQPGTSKIRDITVEAELFERDGGIGRTVWKLNGQTIGIVAEDRGIGVVSTASSKAILISKLLTLSPGKNLIEIIVYNKAGGMASDPAALSLTLEDAVSEPPALHILAIGINRYRDKSLWLNYAVPDATAIAKRLQIIGKGIFTRISAIELYDQDASLPAIAQAFDRIAMADKTNDVFILYLAGHGITLDGRYHFLPVDFRYRNEDSIRQNAINQDHLQKWLASLNSRKSLVLLDTCNSGSFTEAQVVTRGIAEKTAIDKLTRATGRATIAASTDSQVAYEGYNGHGVFTYALLQALSQADQTHGNRDAVTTTLELASFVEEFVPNITYKKWGGEQVPQINLHGSSFPIGVVE